MALRLGGLERIGGFETGGRLRSRGTLPKQRAMMNRCSVGMGKNMRNEKDKGVQGPKRG